MVHEAVELVAVAIFVNHEDWLELSILIVGVKGLKDEHSEIWALASV